MSEHWRRRKTEMINVGQIVVGERILTPSEARITAMAKSLSSDLGQLYPILISKHVTDSWRVVAGATRLLAAQQLGWNKIEATIIGADNEYEYKLIEIAENLERHDLTEIERKLLKDKERELRAERLAHFDKLARGDQPDAPPKKAKGGRGKKGGVADAARKAGVPLSTAQDRLKKKPTGNANPVGLATAIPSEPKREQDAAARVLAPEHIQSNAESLVRFIMGRDAVLPGLAAAVMRGLAARLGTDPLELLKREQKAVAPAA